MNTSARNKCIIPYICRFTDSISTRFPNCGPLMAHSKFVCTYEGPLNSRLHGREDAVSAMGRATIRSPSSPPYEYKPLTTHKPCAGIGFTLGP